MKKTEEFKTITFCGSRDGFYIDIVERKTGITQWDIWLYRDSIGIKEYVFGLCRDDNKTLSQVSRMVENYLIVDTDNDGFNWYDSYDEQYN